jgi:hypothetical protein
MSEPIEIDFELILRDGLAAIAAAASTDALAQVETDLFGKRCTPLVGVARPWAAQGGRTPSARGAGGP